MEKQPQKKNNTLKIICIACVIIVIIFFIFALIFPNFCSITPMAINAKALSNARQVGTACRSYADDQGGFYPAEIDPKTGAVIVDKNGNPIPPANSNIALKSLIPVYVPTEELFYVEGSRFAPLPPDEIFDTDATKLQKGENHWGYVFGNVEPDNKVRLLIFDGAADPKSGRWGKDSRGEGKNAIIVLTDLSASNAKLDKNGRLTPPNDIYFRRGKNGRMKDSLTPLNPK